MEVQVRVTTGRSFFPFLTPPTPDVSPDLDFGGLNIEFKSDMSG